MTRAEWIEVLLIGVVAIASPLAWTYFPAAMPLWQIVLGLSALLLAQSLVRDVAILFRQHRLKSNAPPKEGQCFCLESTVGATGIIAGAALVGLGMNHPVALGHLGISLALAGTMILGFFIKDFVITWNPLGMRREKDHVNLLVRWKRKPN